MLSPFDDKTVIVFLIGWLLLIHIFYIYERDERAKGEKKSVSNDIPKTWYEYLSDLNCDELADFLGSPKDFGTYYCNSIQCPHHKEKVECEAFNDWFDKGQSSDDYPCVRACKNWLNSYIEEN